MGGRRRQHSPVWRGDEAVNSLYGTIGLSCNRFLAKLASEMDKPRGFGVIGQGGARLSRRPAGSGHSRWARSSPRATGGGRHYPIADLQALGADRLGQRYGSTGRRLAELADGIDGRAVVPDRDAKGISAETTFEEDLSTAAELKPELWRLCERVAERMKKAGLSSRTAVLKLKTSEFRILTRRHALGQPTQYADNLYRAAVALLEPELGRRRYRLIGVGLHDLTPSDAEEPDLFAPEVARGERVERAIDEVRARFGQSAIGKGRGLRGRPPAVNGCGLPQFNGCVWSGKNTVDSTAVAALLWPVNDSQELLTILANHEKWLAQKAGGSRVNLTLVDMQGVTLNNANLQAGKFSGANLSRAILSRANLTGKPTCSRPIWIAPT